MRFELPRWAVRLITGVGVSLVLAAVVVFALPTRQVWAQQNEIAAAQRQLDTLTTENSRLQARIAAAEQPAELERLARRSGYVRPGQEAYTVMPPVGGGLYLPELWPFSDLRDALEQQVPAPEPRAAVGLPGAPVFVPVTGPVGAMTGAQPGSATGDNGDTGDAGDAGDAGGSGPAGPAAVPPPTTSG